MIRSILLPVDGSIYSESVLQYGIFLGKKLDALLRVITVIDLRLFEWNMSTGADNFIPVVTPAEFQEETHKMLETKADAILHKSKAILQESGLAFELNKITGIPVDEICVASKSCDLVIMGIRGEYEHWTSRLLGAVTEAVTRQIAKPVLLVDRTFTEIKRVLCGYDRSDSSNKALQLSAFLAGALKTEVQVAAVFNQNEEREEVLEEAEQYLKPYKIEFTLRHETGTAAEALIEAQNSAPFPSLLCMGSYGHSRLREAILGSTTVQVMRKANKPILLAK